MIQDPQQQAALLNTILSNQDGEGMHDLSRYARKNLINMGIVEPDEQEAKEMAEGSTGSAESAA